MSNWDVINDLKTKSKDELRAIVEEYADKATHALSEYIDGNIKLATYSIFSTVLMAVIADDRFDEDEYYVAKPVLDMVLGDGISYEDTVEGVKIALGSLKTEDLNTAVNTLATDTDPELKHTLYVLCSALCVADDELSTSELDWLSKFAD